MFVLTILGSLLLLASIIAIVRHSRETKIECGPMHPCLGATKKSGANSAAQ